MSLLRPAQAVIYTQSLEPITVIDMKPWYWNYLSSHGRISFHIKDEPSMYFNAEYEEMMFNNRLKEVRVLASYIKRGDESFFLLTTDGEVEALLLDSSVLPGQQRKFNEEKKKAFARGFLSALMTRTGE